MAEEEKSKVISESWQVCEEGLKAVAAHAIASFEEKVGTLRYMRVLELLQGLKLLNGDKLSDLGRSYYYAKYVTNDQKASQELLLKALKDFPPVQAICQVLWGRPNLKRANVYYLLTVENLMDPLATGEEDIGGFLALLNQVGIVSYSKKTKGVRILYNPRTTDVPRKTPRFISPETPFSNLRAVWDILRGCRGYVYWFDKHFSVQGLEVVHEEADGSQITRVRILTGIANDSLNNKMLDRFKRFKEELKARGIEAELRVICDKDVLNQIHDRWIMSANTCFNVPPINSILAGQLSEVKETDYRPPFEDWWRKGLDIISEWSSIQANRNTGSAGLSQNESHE